MRLVYPWLCELVKVPGDPESVATTLALRGFEVASIEHGRQPVIDFEITANRPDCLSTIGLAREASAAYGVPLRMPDRTMPAPGNGPGVEVAIEDANLCPRYCAQVFEVRIGTSPAWLQERLEAAGVRPINNVVDVTNYVMLEMGQPMHAFDLARLGGRALRIRRAKRGEKIRTLDGVERTLDGDMLVIADAARPQAVGGVMGGADAEIDAKTTSMVLESAYFTPASVRRTSKRLALKTEASTRFERGADVNAPPVGIARAAALLDQFGAARPVGPIVDRYPAPRPPVTLALRGARLTHVLGLQVPADDVPRILTPLGFTVSPSDRGGAGWQVEVPTYRVDVQREIDLVEEVARHYGYDRLPATFPALASPQAPPDARTLQDRLVRQVLTACGFSEATTFTFIEQQAATPFADGAEPAALANPLSEKFAVLRPSLLPGLIDACAYNRRRERRDVRLFETGARFPPAGEARAVAFAWCGAGSVPNWSAATRPVDFFDVKGIVEALCGAMGATAAFEPATRSYLVPGRAAQVLDGSGDGARAIGVVGQIQPAILDARGFPAAEPIYAAELDLDALGALGASDIQRAEPLPRFPAIVRDLSILVDDGLPAAAVRGTIRRAAPPTLVQLAEFDRYRGKGIPEGRVSLSLRLSFRSSERTLTDAEVDEAMTRVVAALEASHGAQRR